MLLDHKHRIADPQSPPSALTCDPRCSGRPLSLLYVPVQLPSSSELPTATECPSQPHSPRQLATPVSAPSPAPTPAAGSERLPQHAGAVFPERKPVITFKQQPTLPPKRHDKPTAAPAPPAAPTSLRERLRARRSMILLKSADNSSSNNNNNNSNSNNSNNNNNNSNSNSNSNGYNNNGSSSSTNSSRSGGGVGGDKKPPRLWGLQLGGVLKRRASSQSDEGARMLPSPTLRDRHPRPVELPDHERHEQAIRDIAGYLRSHTDNHNQPYPLSPPVQSELSPGMYSTFYSSSDDGDGDGDGDDGDDEEEEAVTPVDEQVPRYWNFDELRCGGGRAVGSSSNGPGRPGGSGGGVGGGGSRSRSGGGGGGLGALGSLDQLREQVAGEVRWRQEMGYLGSFVV